MAKSTPRAAPSTAEAAHTAGGDLVSRSVEIIVANQAPNGAFPACPQFPIYRYSWLRDGAFICEGLDAVGELEAARRFHDWLAGIVLKSRDGIERSISAVKAGRWPEPEDYLHCRYELDGRLGPSEWPTFQLDGPGIWLWALAHHLRSGGALTDDHREAARLVARYLGALWALPCADAWEESPENVSTSTLGAIVAGLRALPEIDQQAARLEEVATALLAVEARLLDDSTERFRRSSGDPSVDGSLLWLAVPYELVDLEGERFRATLAEIERALVSADGGVYRYTADTYYGGGEWIPLTAYLARIYLRRGRPGDRERAERARRWIEAQARPDGSLPEQVPTRARYPEHIQPWRATWGETASPLLWSHGAYLALVADLEN